MKRKLTSRKFLAALVTGILTIFAEELGIPPESVKYLIGIAAAYILGEGAVDYAREQNK